MHSGFLKPSLFALAAATAAFSFAALLPPASKAEDATIELVWDPPWNPQMMSAAARKQLKLDE